MSGRKRYERAITSLAERKESKSLILSGILGVTTGGENVVEVGGRPGYVWVRLRNQLNELIQAFNESVSPVFDLPVMVEYDKFSPTRYKVINRDTGRYSSWGSWSSYTPAHEHQHEFDPNNPGGDITWIYSQQFMPFLATPSGSSGAMSVSLQPHVYYWSNSWGYAGGTGIAIDPTLLPTGTTSARMLLVYLDQPTGNFYIATGSLTEFNEALTGTADVLPYIPTLLDNNDMPIAGVRLVTGTATIQWPNLYDVRLLLDDDDTAGQAPADAEYVVMSLDGTLTDERVLTAGADIDIDDGGAGGNATVGVSTGTFSRAGHDHILMTLLTIEGNLVVESNPLRIYNRYGETRNLSEVFLSVNTAPTDSSIIVDVHKDGTTIFTTQSNRPVIAAGANTGFTTTIEVPSWAVGEYLTMDVDQIGSGTVGSNLTVHITHS